MARNDWLRDFDKELMAGRAFQLFKEMHERLNDRNKTIMSRIEEILAKQPADPLRGLGLSDSEDKVTRVLIAQGHAMAENILLVVAIQLAKLEASQPPPTE